MRKLTAMRRIAMRLEPGARSLILLYHRLGTPATDPWHLAVSPERFTEHLHVLRDGGYRTVTLAEIVESVRRRRPLERAVAVTFDDGYGDNLDVGLPLLERFGVPATVYATAGTELERREPWWMELEALLLEPGVLPERLAVDVEGFRWTWTLNGTATWTREQALVHARWCVADAGPAPSARHAAFRSLMDRLARVDPRRRDAVLAHLYKAARIERVRRPSHRLMDAAQLRRLAAGGLVDVGAHTLTHPKLAQLPADAQRTEITQSKARLEEVLGRPVSTFAYPFGTHRDFDDRSVRAVREAGFQSAVAVCDRAVSRSSDPFALPRVGIVDWTGDELEWRLHRWLRRWP